MQRLPLLLARLRGGCLCGGQWSGRGRNRRRCEREFRNDCAAAEVRTASTSGVGTMGVAGAQAARIKVAITAKSMNFVFIVPLLICYPASNILRGSA